MATRVSAGVALVVGFVVLASIESPRIASGAVRTWSGAGTDDLWSNSVNWVGGAAPTSGDDVLFGMAGSGDNIDNRALSLGAIRFAPQILPEHNFHLASGATLALTGFGIDNVSRLPGFSDPPIPPGVGRQQFFMEPGSTIAFQNSATVGGSDPVFNLPVDLTALGATTAAGIGGKILFENSSTASGLPALTFTGLRASGGTVDGAGGGELVFRDDASLGLTANITVEGGQVAGALGGTAIFEGRAIASSGNNFAFSGAGLGGRIIFRDQAQAVASFGNVGAMTLDAGNEAITQFLDSTNLQGTAQNFSGQGAGMAGGRLEFRQTATLGGAGGGFIINQGSSFGGEGGRTVFYDDSRIDSDVTILNQTQNEGPAPSSTGGVTEFLDRARAGSATISNGGASSSAGGALSGRTYFRQQSDAEDADLTAQRGTNGGPGGAIFFSDAADGNRAKITVESGALLDVSALTSPTFRAASVAGAGTFLLGSKSVTLGATGLSSEVTGSLQDGGQNGGVGAALVKAGAGSLTLGGANTYTGSTTVNGGLLYVNGSIGGAGVSVASGAALGGAGTINAPVAFAADARIAPGAQGDYGVLTTGALTLAPTTNLEFQLRAGLHDQVAVNGPLTLDGTLNVIAPTGLAVGAYRLIDYTGPLTDNGLVLGALPAGTTAADFTLITGTPGQVDLVLGGAAGDLLLWDGSQTTPNNLVNGGSGAWNNATTNWTNAAGSVQQAWNGKTAVFTGAAGTVTIGQTVSVRGMQFLTSDYVVNSAAGQSIALDGATEMRIGGFATTTVNAALSGSGSLTKTGTGTLVLSGANSYSGGTTVSDGFLRVTNSAGLGLGVGPVTVAADKPALQHSLAFDANASAGSISIVNLGSSQPSVFAATGFTSNSTAGAATIVNRGDVAVGGLGGDLLFVNSSQAGAATITNHAADFSSFLPSGEQVGYGRTAFAESASAGSANIVNAAGNVAGLPGGKTLFDGLATASTSHIFNRGGSVAGALGGVTEFTGNSTAGAATITLEGGPDVSAGGTLRFKGLSTGGLARIIFATGSGPFGVGMLDINESSFSTVAVGSIEGSGFIPLAGKRLEVGGNNLATTFAGQIYGSGSLRKVGSSTLTMASANSYSGGTQLDGGTLKVTSPTGLALGSGNAAVSPGATLAVADQGVLGVSATIAPAAVASGVGGRLQFSGDAVAGTVAVNQLGSLHASFGAQAITTFADNSSAGNALFLNRGGAAAGDALGGAVSFFQNATAGTAQFFNDGGQLDGAEGGTTSFQGFARGGAAQLTNYGTSTLLTSGFGNGGSVQLSEQSNAESAQITNYGALSASGSPGQLRVIDAASTGQAVIVNKGGAVAGAPGGQTVFADDSTAGDAQITAEGSNLVGARGGAIVFLGNSSAGNATITVTAGPTAGDLGGTVQFRQNSSGAAARVVLAGNGAATLDISLLTASGTNVGSVEGQGNIRLGEKNFAVGGNNLSTTFAGVIADGGAGGGAGGSLTKVGGGTLTLTGANSFTGATTVLDGVLRVNGSLAGPVTVQGGTLGGNGTFNGGVTVGPGGVVNPGASIGAFTTQGLLAFGTGSIYGLEIDSSADAADRVAAVNVSIGTGVTMLGMEIGSGSLPFGSQVKIIDNLSADPTVGTFDGLPEGAKFIVGNNLLQISYTGGDGNDVILTNTLSLPADFDENGAVNAADLARWKSSFGTLTGALHAQGDADGDAAVDGSDFLVWQRQLGGTLAVANGASVPEPAASSIALLSISTVLALSALNSSRRRVAL